MQGSNEDADIENELVDKGGGGKEGEGEMKGESNMDIYTTICKIDSQRKLAV